MPRVLLVKLLQSALKGLSLNIASIYCCSDSMIALYWIKNNQELKIIDIINKNVKSDNWNYISSFDKSDDIDNRECLPNLIVNNKLWRFGPEFLLKNKESWPENNFNAAKSNVAVNWSTKVKYSLVLFLLFVHVHVYQTEKNSILIEDIQSYYLYLIILQNSWCYLHMIKFTTQVLSLRLPNCDWIIGSLKVDKLFEESSIHVWHVKRFKEKYYDHHPRHCYLNIEYAQNFHFKLTVLTSLVLYMLKTHILNVLMLINALFWYLHVQQGDIFI